MAMALGPFSSTPGIASSMTASQPHEQTWDAVETYFECITTAPLMTASASRAVLSSYAIPTTTDLDRVS